MKLLQQKCVLAQENCEGCWKLDRITLDVKNNRQIIKVALIQQGKQNLQITKGKVRITQQTGWLVKGKTGVLKHWCCFRNL